MPQSLSQIYIHLVFSTKDRRRFISESIAPNLYAYMATVFHDECRSPAKLIGGVEDHIHALFNLARTWSRQREALLLNFAHGLKCFAYCLINFPPFSAKDPLDKIGCDGALAFVSRRRMPHEASP